jgi:calcineurin-like phosphoesterase family protein
VIGNHDKQERLTGFTWIKDVYKLRAGGKRIWLSHYPHRYWPGSHKGNIHLYGHEHGNVDDHGRSTDVGVDCWSYKPVHLNTILKYMENKEVLKHHV